MAAGMSPRPMMADTASEASSIRPNTARIVFTAWGFRRMRTARLATEPVDLTVGQDHLEAEDVVGGHPVLEGVGPARVGGDVAADGAGLLARRIRGVIEPARAHRPGQ